jgi:Fic family protein
MFKSGKYLSQGKYKTFQPTPLSEVPIITDIKIQSLLAEAMRHLGELNAYSELVPDIDYFVRMHLLKEATSTSFIENINTSLETALQDEKEIEQASIEERDDWEEVQNYTKAINYAIERLHELPFSTHLICETHEVLLSGVRGFTRAPGQTRRVQNFIGGSDITSAVFVPPSPETVPGLMSDLEQYWHDEALPTPPLIRAAICHYQFETIHPFLDGNGRLGRLLIALQLIDSKLLNKPTLYISDYFEKHRAAYYDSLDRVRASGDIEQWLRFFLTGVAEIAADACANLRAIVALRQNYLERINQSVGIRRQKNARALLQMLYAQPIVSVSRVETMLGCATETARLLVEEFVSLGMFTELTPGRKKNRSFVLTEYFELFNTRRSV